MRDAYEIMFENDHADTSWTGAEIRSATERLTAALPEGSGLRSFDCRESMCRIETIHPDVSHYHAFVRSAFIEPETKIWNAGTSSSLLSGEPAEGGSLVTVSYLARDGHDLPPPE